MQKQLITSVNLLTIPLLLNNFAQSSKQSTSMIISNWQTADENVNRNIMNKCNMFYFIILLVFFSTAIIAQETDSTETLFDSETKVGFVWGGEIKINSIQNKTGTLIGFYGGALLKRSTLLGLAIGANVGHPTVNYSYFGVLAQYSYKPQELFHGSAQLLFSFATTKDYEQAKSSTMDNFLNTSGAPFYFVEPGLNAELNLSNSLRAVFGLSYRFAFELDESSEYVSKTKVTNSELSGINLIIGLKFGKY